jgi:glycosyltransferase involved in cell wall biosynthesis
MSLDLVSVIIPTYERSHILDRSIKSVLNQSYENLELIIVDDGSKDSILDLVSEIKDSRMRSIRLPENKGAAAARNAGIKISNGDFIAFLDSDDEWLPDKLQLSLDIFKNNDNGNIGLVYTNGWLVKENQKNSYFENLNPSRFIYTDDERKLNIFPTSIVSPGPPFWMLPKKIVSRIGFFDERMRNWEDVDFFVRVANSYDIYFLNIPLAVIYEQEQSLGTINFDVIKSRQIYLEKHKKQMSKDKQNLYVFTKKMGKDLLILGDKKSARKYFLHTLKIKPYKIEILAKIFKTFV